MKNSFLSQAKSYLILNYGKELGLEIYENANARFIELKAENKDESKEMYAHTRTKIYPCISVLDAQISNGIPRDKALNFMVSFIDTRSNTYAKIVRNLLKMPLIYKKIPYYFGVMTKKNFGEKQNFSADFYEISDKVMCFDMTKCPYNDILLKYNYPEITKCFCRGDDIVYGNMHPKLIWGRTKTIGDGDTVCDFKLTRKD